MKRVDAQKLAKLHHQLSAYVSWNLNEAIAPRSQAELELLRNRIQDGQHAAPDVAADTSVPIHEQTKHRQQGASDVSPASWLAYHLEREFPDLLDYLKSEADGLVYSAFELDIVLKCCEFVPPFGLDYEWQLWNAPHNTLSKCLLHLTKVLGSGVVFPLKHAAEKMSGLRTLHGAISACREVINALTDMLAAAGHLEFVPAPQGTRRTISTQQMLLPPTMIAHLVAGFRDLLIKRPGAKEWTMNQLSGFNHPMLKGRRESKLDAIRFLIGTGELATDASN